MGFKNKFAFALIGIFLFSIIAFVYAREISLENLFSGKSENNAVSISELNIPGLTKEFSKAKVEISKKQKEINLNEVKDALANSAEGKVGIIVWVNEKYKAKKVVSELKDFEVKYIYEVSNGFAGKANLADIKKLSKNKKINYIVLDKEVEGALMQSRPLVGVNNVETSYNLTGAGIGVCVLDTGVNYNHPNLMQAYVGGYDFINNDPDPMDDHGHGTKVAGIVASNHNLARGMAPNVNLVVVKVLAANGFGTNSAVAAGIDWCVSHKAQYNISVISMSIVTVGGVYTPSTNPAFYEPSLASAYNNNIALVAASGNYGSTSGITYPAISPYVISVGATYDENFPSLTFNTPGFSCIDTPVYADRVTCFSNRAPFLNLMAPGAVILTTTLSGSLTNCIGTSCSTPHVSGIIALMLQRNKNLLPSQIKDILINTGNPVYDNVTSMTFPRVNGWNAVNAVPYLNKTGSLTSNSVISLNINDPLNSGAIYLLALAFTSNQGIPLPDGRIIPLDYDDLLVLSIQDPASVFLTGSVGALNPNGQATATITIPIFPGIENIEAHAAFITVNGTSGEIISVSNQQRL